MTAWKTPPPAGRLMLGSEMDGTWFIPLQPSNAIHYRDFTAAKHDWSRADFILDASPAQGSTICDGSADQISAPREEFRHLTLQSWWAVVGG